MDSTRTPAVFSNRGFTGVLVESTGTPYGLYNILYYKYSKGFTGVLVESCGLHMDSAVFYSREFTGVLVESLWTPHGLYSIL